MNKAKFDSMIPHANATIVLVTPFEEDDMLDDVLMSAIRSHHTKKSRARETYLANSTHPRDHSATLKHNQQRRGEKLYNKAGRTRKRKNADKRDVRTEIDLVFGNKHHGLGYVDDPELFASGYNIGYEDGYGEGFNDGCAATNDTSHNESGSPVLMPWENIELVMYLFDDAESFLIKHKNTKEKYASEFKLMRTALEHSVNKLTNTNIPVLADIIFPEDILLLLLGEAGYAYMTELSMHHLMDIVAHNLYALYNQPELHQYYLELLKDRDANCE